MTMGDQRLMLIGPLMTTIIRNCRKRRKDKLTMGPLKSGIKIVMIDQSHLTTGKLWSAP